MDFAWYVIGFVAAIGVLVTVHEFGHFWVARRLGVKVLRFSIGFGRPLAMWRSGADRTEYVVAAVPLGGYVRMLDEREGDVAEDELPRAFNRQGLGVRTAIVLAGPLFNFLFAIFAYWVMFMLGVSGARPWIGDVESGSLAARSGLDSGQEIVAVDERPTPTWEAAIQAIIAGSLDGPKIPLTLRSDTGERKQVVLDMGSVVVDDLTRGRFFEPLGFQRLAPRFTPVLGRIEPGGAADRAGLKPGDRVLRADGQPMPGWSEWVEFVRERPEVRTRVTVERQGREVEVELTPAAQEPDGIGLVGVYLEPLPDEYDKYFITVRHSVMGSAAKAVEKTYQTTVLTLRFLWSMVRLEISLKNLSGPISIAQYAGITAKLGIVDYISFLALVSISLGILNLLPIPVLDGGHLMYYLVELVKGRPVSEATQFLGQRVGLAMLFGLMGLAVYNDLSRLLG